MHVDYDADIEVAVDVDADLRMYGESIHIQLYTGISECICFPYCSKKHLKTTFFKQILSVFNCTSPIKLKVYGILKVN